MSNNVSLQSLAINKSIDTLELRDIDPHVKTYAPSYFLRGQRVLVPLCRDNSLLWFREHALHTIGIERDKSAIEQFLQIHNIPYQKTTDGRYEAERLTIFNRHILEIDSTEVGQIDFVCDRDALQAVLENFRRSYIEKLDELVSIKSKCLLVILEYDSASESKLSPSIKSEQIAEYFGDRYAIDLIERSKLFKHPIVQRFDLNFCEEYVFFLTKMSEKKLLDRSLDQIQCKKPKDEQKIDKSLMATSDSKRSCIYWRV
jgi:thiopurine S-methyltransferase